MPYTPFRRRQELSGRRPPMSTVRSEARQGDRCPSFSCVGKEPTRKSDITEIVLGALAIIACAFALVAVLRLAVVTGYLLHAAWA